MLMQNHIFFALENTSSKSLDLSQTQNTET